MKTSIFALIAATLFVGSLAQAECKLSIDRTACPDKKEAAYKPYGGKNPTDETTKAADEAACVKDAEKASKIIRKGTLSKKTVTAMFGGKEVGKKEDSAACK